MGNKITSLHQEVRELKSSIDSEAVATTEQRAIDLQAEIDRLKVDLGESEQQRRVRSMVDELLKMTRDAEALQSELQLVPAKAIADYKEPIGFKSGVQKTGQVSFEYGYRVALARFQVRYLNLEVEEIPFTCLPKDESFSMEVDHMSTGIGWP
ncbi:hypothetical protein BHE74_00039491 [Ensete ventricosum]|nr:hypothetical protein BHE74_00039491 [Ensete ventricosum]